MSRIPFLALCAVAAILAAIVVSEIREPAPTQERGEGVVALPAPVAAAKPASVRAGAAQVQAWVGTILARPLFTRDRRPAEASATAVAAAESLPRLTGIAISPTGRHAIFANVGGKPLVISPGDRVSGFTVRAIDPGGVTVVGPDGPRVLQPSFDSAPKSAGGPARSSPRTPAAARGLPGAATFGRPRSMRAQFPEAEFNRLAQRPAEDAP